MTSTLEGFTSRCSLPAWWSADSPSTSWPSAWRSRTTAAPESGGRRGRTGGDAAGWGADSSTVRKSDSGLMMLLRVSSPGRAGVSGSAPAGRSPASTYSRKVFPSTYSMVKNHRSPSESSS